MSIIHEALKKVERDREPRPHGLSRFGRGRTARRRWRAGAATGLLISLSTVGVGSLWLWTYVPWRNLTVSTVAPLEQNWPDKLLEREDQAPQPTLSAHTPPIQPRLAGVLPASGDGGRPSPTPPTLAWEADVAARATFERARAAEAKGQWGEATGYYRQALALNPALVEAQNNLGTLYVRQQQLTAAIDEFRAAIRLDPNYAMVRNNLGSAYILSGQEALAIQEFLAALHIDSTYVSPLYNLASLYARRGDIGQTVAFLTRALAIEPTVLSWLQEDPDFDAVKAAPDIQRLYTQDHAKR